mmetsp:Transcript_11835/g.20867  ORF Transcript_11835/g.20867 Transcript_11835/m.20867 type:complete len:245 (+) Transcript_11835:1-735(+)
MRARGSVLSYSARIAPLRSTSTVRASLSHQAARDQAALQWLMAEKHATTPAPAAAIALRMVEFLEIWDDQIALDRAASSASRVRRCQQCRPINKEPKKKAKCDFIYFVCGYPRPQSAFCYLCAKCVPPDLSDSARNKSRQAYAVNEASTRRLGGLTAHEHVTLICLVRESEANELCLRAVRALLPATFQAPAEENNAAGGGGGGGGGGRNPAKETFLLNISDRIIELEAAERDGTALSAASAKS